MNTTKVLALRFNCANGKKYNVRVKNADSNVTEDKVRQLADTIIKTKAFDFDGHKSAYTLDSATYTTTQKRPMIAAK